MSDTTVDVFFVFPHRVLAEDSDRFFRRTLLGDLCEVGTPEVIGYCVRMAFHNSTFEDQDKVTFICNRVIAEIRRLASEDEKIFPGIDRKTVLSLPCKVQARQPQLDDQGRPMVDWDSIPAPTTSDSEASTAPAAQSDEEVIQQLNELIRTFIDSLDSIRDLLLFRANRGETATQALENILDRVQSLNRELSLDTAQQEHDMYVAYAPFIEEAALLALSSRLLGSKTVHMGAISYFVTQYNASQEVPELGTQD